MLAKNKKANKNTIKKVFLRSYSKHSPSFIIRFINEENATNSKSSVLVSSKIYKKAVDRNKIKRIIYSILNSLNKDLKKGYAFVLIIKKPLNDRVFVSIKAELTNLLKEVGIL